MCVPIPGQIVRLDPARPEPAAVNEATARDAIAVLEEIQAAYDEAFSPSGTARRPGRGVKPVR